MRGFKRFWCVSAACAGTLGLIFATSFVFLRAFDYADARNAAPAAVSAASRPEAPSSGAVPEPPSEEEPSTVNGELSSEPFTEGEAEAEEKELLLVNYEHKLPEGYKPELVEVDGIQMDAVTAEAYREMRDAAKKDGVTLYVSSGYRSTERQEKLFEQEVETYEQTAGTRKEAEAFAEKSVARPGCSEHSTGLAVDLNGVLDSFDGTDAFRWLDGHAQEYGFILRYPKDKQEITKIKYEPWHYRYVGAEHAKVMKEKNLCLEEYLASLAKTGSAN